MATDPANCAGKRVSFGHDNDQTSHVGYPRPETNAFPLIVFFCQFSKVLSGFECGDFPKN